jgi:anti-sigma B factor antagonist
MQLSIQQKSAASGAVVLALEGGIVAGRCPALEEHVVALVASGQTRVVLDLTGVTMLDSAGVGSIVACLTKLKKAGGDLRIAGACGKAESVLKMTQVDKVIRFFPTVEAAAQ